MPDAIHLAACWRLEASMMTLDDRLAAAAGQLSVAVVRPG